MTKRALELLVISLTVIALLLACSEPVGTTDAAGEGPSVPDDAPRLLIDVAVDASGSYATTRNGFFIESYPGSTLNSVELFMSSSVAGQATIDLEVSRDDYLAADAEPPVGAELLPTTATTTTSLAVGTKQWVRFDFGEVAVEPGSLLVFKLEKVAFTPDTETAAVIEIEYDTDALRTDSTPRVIQTRSTDTIYDPFGLGYDERGSYMPIRVTGRP